MGLSWGPDGADSGILLYPTTTPTTEVAAPEEVQKFSATAALPRLRANLLRHSSPAIATPPQTRTTNLLRHSSAVITPLKETRSTKMPVMAIGTWQLSGSGLRKALRTALVECNYRAIDCASSHQNEAEIGEVLEEIFELRHKTTGEALIKREDLFITSKLWNDAHVTRGVGDKSRVIDACQQTLRDLRLDYLDMYLINFPVGFVPNTLEATQASQINANASLNETWEAMEELVNKGLVRAIGVSNFEIDDLETILSSPSLRIKPAVNQIETHPYLLRRELIQYCHTKGIAVCAYAPLGSPSNPWSRLGFPKLMEDDIVLDLAEKYGKTPAQILLRWALQRGNSCGMPMGVVVKSEHADHIRSNVKVFDFLLSEDDIKELESKNRGTRFVHPITPWLGRGSFRRV